MQKENVLIVTPYFPYPITSGGAQAQFHMIDHLRKQCQITLAYIPTRDGNDKVLQEMWSEVKFCPFEVLRETWLMRKKRQLTRLLGLNSVKDGMEILNPALVHSFEGGVNYRFLNFLEEIIRTSKINIVQFEFAEFLNMAFAFPDVKRVFVQHEIHFIRNQRFIRDLNTLPASDRYQFNMLKQQEITAMNNCHAVIVLTEIDKHILEEEHVTVPILVSPAIIPSPVDELPDQFDFNEKLVFLGGSTHMPNYEGVMWFLENVWAGVLKEYPLMRLQIIGKWKKRIINRIKDKFENIDFLGYVPILDPYLSNSIMIIPILSGSGMRMKIIDAANNGTPFITTRVGVEGLDFEHYKDCFIADDADDFTRRLLELATDRQMQLLFRKNAFDRMKKSYSTEALLKKRLDCYRTVLQTE